MNYLLDTNICIYIIRQKPLSVLQKFETLNIGQLAISSVTAAELRYGAAKSQYPERNQSALTAFLMPLVILPFTEETAVAYGHLRAHLERIGQPIGALDMMIAAQALEAQLPLVTNNEREFQRVPSLTVENWVNS